MKFAALFAAFVSVFGLTSCLDNGDSGPRQYQSLMTLELSYAGTVMYADEYPGQALIPLNADLYQFGISPDTKRALVTYTVPEDQNATEKQANIMVTAAQTWPVFDISNRPDTCAAYTDPIVGFSNYTLGWTTFKSGCIIRNRYMNVGYQYRPYSKYANVVMLPNRVSNDTVYLDFKMKKTEQTEGQTQLFMNTYDLYSYMARMNKITPKNDSIYVTVVGLVSPYGNDARKDSITNRCRYVY